jgi:m7GpppX diphosphatase
LIIERAAFPTDPETLRAFHSLLTNVCNLGANDIYAWYLANVAAPAPAPAAGSSTPSAHGPDLKLTLIHPCTPTHVKKYSPQRLRVVTETPAVFRAHVRPFMLRQQREGRLAWVHNILDGRSEQENVIHREADFLLLPDMNWDRRTLASLRVLCLVRRRDLLSLRDLRRADLAWLRGLHAAVRAAVARAYAVDPDQLVCYVHYQPTYYHFHVHVVSVDLEPGPTQAVGKAFSLPNVIALLEAMAGGPEAGMADLDVTYTLGEGSELWEEVFGVLKEGGVPA